ncbi:MAG TPA: hypothetical protein VLI54_00925 [Bacillota bacterium]|nr:hypothetical protein [Bacillota bacterium]
MEQNSLYEGKKITSWSLDRVAEVLCEEWSVLSPELEKGVSIYGKKTTQITFKGEVHVALELTRQKYPDKDSIAMYIGLSLSPLPYDLKTHVLNTLDMGMFMQLFPQLHGKHFFTIAKSEPWKGSLFSTAAQALQSVVRVMLNFESCFHLLLDDEYHVGGVRLASSSLSLTHHLNQVKAYRLAEIYGYPEKLDEAVQAIKGYAQTDELSQQRLDKMCAAKSAGGMGWLYTPEILERLCT